MVSVRNKFDTLQEIFKTHNPNDKCKNFVTVFEELVAEFILTKPRAKYSVPCESIVVRKKRDYFKKMHPYSIKETKYEPARRN